MLTVTPGAAEKLRELGRVRLSVGCSIRIRVLGAACSGYHYQMTYDKRDGKNDEILEIGGCQILVDFHSWRHLQSTTLDYEENQGGAGFKFIRFGQNHCEGCGGACR